MSRLECSLNPYHNLDWHNLEQHKANLHTHTNQSDGQLYPDAVIDIYQKAGYTILALTDHDSRHGLQKFINHIRHPAGQQQDRRFPDPANSLLRFPENYDYEQPDWSQVKFTEQQLEAIAGPTWPWSNWNRYPDEFKADPRTGVLANGMLPVKGNELSNHGHISSYYNDCAIIKWNPARAEADNSEQLFGTEQESLTQVGAAGGLACLNHPSLEPGLRDHYEALFATNPCLIGLEVCQPWQHDATSLWDQMLTRFMPERPVWGLAADDFHGIIHFGYGWNVMLIDELNHDKTRKALENGQFYFVRSNQLWHKKDGVANPEFYRVRGIPPVIRRINLDRQAGRISIEASGYDSIHWISQGRELASGENLEYREHAMLDKYIRAELRVTDQWGIQSCAYTNPFGFSRV